MNDFLATALNVLAHPFVLIASWSATIILGVVLGRLGGQMQGGAQPPDLIELELTIRPENFTHILETWIERAGFERSLSRFRLHTRLDILFATLYPFALAGLLAAWLRAAPLMGDRLVALFILAAVLAGLLDILVENRTYLRILDGLASPQDLANIKAGPIRTAFAGAAAKWLLLALALLAVLGGAASQLVFALQAFQLAWALPLAAFLLTAFYSLVLFPRAAQDYRGGQGANVMALQLAFTKTRFVEIFTTWIRHSPDPDPVQAFRRQLRRLDYAYPLLYALLFASLALVVHGSVGAGGELLLGLAFWLPFAAALFDMLENTVHFVLLQQVTPDSLARIPSRPVRWASVFATLKFLCLLASLALTLLLFLVPAG